MHRSLIALLLLTACGEPAPAPLRVLVLSGGGYHDFAGNLAQLMPLVNDTSFSVITLGSPGAAGVLARGKLSEDFDAILAYTQGELGLGEAERAALLQAVADGVGLVALHCALDSHPGWTAWDGLLGARFESHPPFGPIEVSVTGPAHPVMAGLPPTWSLRDEFYHLTPLAQDGTVVLMQGTSPAGGPERPVTWARAAGRGRVVATILGHGPETHADQRFARLVEQALAWTAGRS